MKIRPPGVVSDPNTLTKDKLKRELNKHNVVLPSGDSKKDVYVELYRQHVLGQRKEFSSDDEITKSPVARKKKPGSPRKVPSKAPNTSTDMDVYNLSDKQLRDELRNHNVECGPIIDSTRRIYQRKLEKVLREGPPLTSRTEASQSDTLPIDELDFSDQDEPEPEPEPVKKKTTKDRQEVRQRVLKQPREPEEEQYQRPSFRDEPRVQPTSYSSSSTTRTTYSSRAPSSRTQEELTPFSASDIVTQAPETISEEPAPKKGGLSIWVQLLLVLIVAFFIFLVFQNMEPAAKAPPRGLDHEEV